MKRSFYLYNSRVGADSAGRTAGEASAAAAASANQMAIVHIDHRAKWPGVAMAEIASLG